MLTGLCCTDGLDQDAIHRAQGSEPPLPDHRIHSSLPRAPNNTRILLALYLPRPRFLPVRTAISRRPGRLPSPQGVSVDQIQI